MKRHTTPTRWPLAALVLLAACHAATDERPQATLLPRDALCSLDGMALADYPGPKAQIRYEDAADAEFFCDTIEMLAIYLRPEQRRRIRAVYVQDMGHTDWLHPVDHWIDARTAWYVKDSRLRGSMGPTLASFGDEKDARAFAQRNGGSVLAFASITPAMVVLDGGALHDQRM